MREKIEQELRDYGLEMSDLTQSELEQLEQEIKANENETVILDGMLFTVKRRKSREITETLLKEMAEAEKSQQKDGMKSVFLLWRWRELNAIAIFH